MGKSGQSALAGVQRQSVGQLVKYRRSTLAADFGYVQSPRRFPPPWSIEESSACFIVRDGDKQALAYVYF